MRRVQSLGADRPAQLERPDHPRGPIEHRARQQRVHQLDRCRPDLGRQRPAGLPGPVGARHFLWGQMIQKRQACAGVRGRQGASRKPQCSAHFG
jgi:hypothetical protein